MPAAYKKFLQLQLGSGTIFTDPQGKKAHRSVQILKESSTWVVRSKVLKKIQIYLYF